MCCAKNTSVEYICSKENIILVQICQRKHRKGMNILKNTVEYKFTKGNISRVYVKEKITRI